MSEIIELSDYKFRTLVPNNIEVTDLDEADKDAEMLRKFAEDYTRMVKATTPTEEQITLPLRVK